MTPLYRLTLLVFLTLMPGFASALELSIKDNGRNFSLPKEETLSAVYLGEGGATLSASFDTEGKKVTLTLPGGGTVVLPQAISASGARYSDGNRTFWEHQDKAVYTEGEKVIFKGSAR